MAAWDWCGAPRVRGLVRVMVWTESTALTVDRLHNPKGYAISVVHLKSNGAGAKAQRVAEEDSSRGQRHGRRRVKLGGGRFNGDTGHVTPKRGHQNVAHGHANSIRHKARRKSSSGRWLHDGIMAGGY